MPPSSTIDTLVQEKAQVNANTSLPNPSPKGRHQFTTYTTYRSEVTAAIYRCYLTHSWEVVIAPPVRFSVVDFSKNRGNHVKVSTFLGLLLAHLGFLGRPVDLLQQERYITCSSLLPPKTTMYVFFYVNTRTHIDPYVLGRLPMAGAELKKNGPCMSSFSLATNCQVYDACVIAAMRGGSRQNKT